MLCLSNERTEGCNCSTKGELTIDFSNVFVLFMFMFMFNGGFT